MFLDQSLEKKMSFGRGRLKLNKLQYQAANLGWKVNLGKCTKLNLSLSSFVYFVYTKINSISKYKKLKVRLGGNEFILISFSSQFAITHNKSMNTRYYIEEFEKRVHFLKLSSTIEKTIKEIDTVLYTFGEG